MSKPYFARPKLAAEIADHALGKTLFGGTPAGTFLAAPRRTGKTTFLVRDLWPALEARGAHVLYVDLWANKEISPSELIARMISIDLAKQQGIIAKTAAKAGLAKVSIHGIEFSLDAVGKAPGATLADALKELHAAVRKQIVLIVDEAQHVITKEPSMEVMFALKSARDAMNMRSIDLALVMSGSDRDKLLRLVNTNSAPFYGAASGIRDLPLLTKEYTDYAAGQLAKAFPALKIDNDRLWMAFQDVGQRPEFFEEAVKGALDPFAGPVADFHERLDAEIKAFILKQDTQHTEMYASLTKLQRAILEWMFDHGADSGLFTKPALAYYTKAVGKTVGPGQARQAIEKLRTREPPVLWKSDRADYALEDQGMLGWRNRLKAKGAWPPA